MVFTRFLRAGRTNERFTLSNTGLTARSVGIVSHGYRGGYGESGRQRALRRHHQLVQLGVARSTAGSFQPGARSAHLGRAAFGEAFAIHFLRDDQHHLSARFAKALSNKWDDVRYRDGVTGCPVLEPALAVMECTLYAQYDGGDHVIIVGRVAHMEKEPGENPLVFFRGRYHTIGAEASH